MVEELATVVLLVLDWVEGEIKLGKQVQLLNIPQLKYFNDIIEGEIEEAKRADILKAF